MLHAFKRDKILAAIAVGIFQPRVQFQAPRLVHHKQRATRRLNPAVEDIQHIFLGAKLGVEKLVEPFSAPHLQRLGDHDRPGDDGENQEAQNDGLAFRCGLLPHIKQFRSIRVGNG